jgi:hypothetical protein
LLRRSRARWIAYAPDVKTLVPHALIVLAILVWAGGHSEGAFLVLFAGGHLLAPIWAAAHASRDRRGHAFLVGPGTIIGVHAVAIVAVWLFLLGGIPEDTWIAMMMVMIWAAALLAYVVYCAIAFGITMRMRR